jgi:hypothetical protein
MVWPTEKSPRCKDPKAPQCHIIMYILYLVYKNDISLMYVKRNNRLYFKVVHSVHCSDDLFTFHYCWTSRPALGPTQPLIQWVPRFFPACKAAQGVILTTHLPLALMLRTSAPHICFHVINRDNLHLPSLWMCRSLFIQIYSKRSKIKMRRILNSSCTKLTVNMSYSPHSSV